MTNIDKHEKIEAVTTTHTRSFFSIHSTGNFCVIEAREVTCVCENCMFGDGQECPNQAYVSSCKAFNLYTGKPILAEAFHNKHWITPESNTPESNGPAQENCCRSHRNSKRKSGHNTIQHEDHVHSSRENSLKRERKACQQNINNIDCTRIYAEIQKCRNYEEMEVLVDSLDESNFEDLHHPIMAAGPDAVVDPVATYHFPSDGLKNLVL